MNKIATIAGLAVAATAMTASAEVLLEIDLTVSGQVTITSTAGLASVSASGSDFTGFYMAGMLNDAASVGSVVGDANAGGNLTTFSNASDGSPSLFSSATSFGINVWSFSTDSTVGVTAGSQAFTGSATWVLDAAEFAGMFGGNTSGDVYFGADTDDDIGGFGVENIGTWVVIPAPSALALLGLGGIVAGRRRR